jgi:ATP-dependent protease HslVU (ClpYQ) peptidase subunit
LTCIVGLLDKGDVYIGGDSAGVAGLSISIRADEKVFGNGPFLMGFTTSFRMGQLLRYKFDPPAQTVGQEDMQYMVTSFIDAARQCFSRNGFGDKDATTGGSFLVGYKGALYSIESDYQVGIPATPFDAVGCGSDLALGAMFATKGMKPEERVRTALEAAAAFSAGVSGPFKIMKLEKPVPEKAKPKKHAAKSVK